MSMLGISENQSGEQNDRMAIGVRIGEQRSLRQRDKKINYAMDNDGDNDNIRGVKRRSISRPIKHTPSTTVQHSNEITKSIEKFYMKKTLGRLKNTDLETIYEDVIDDTATVIDDKKIKNSATAFGLRKLKRRLTFNTTKALKDKRKKRALSILGGGKRFKKVSMQYFLDHLNALNDLHNKEDTNSVDVININSDGDTLNLD